MSEGFTKVEDADSYDEYFEESYVKPFSKISCISIEKKLKKMLSNDQLQSLIKEAVENIRLKQPISRSFGKKFVVNATGLAGLFGKKKEMDVFVVLCLSNDATDDNQKHTLGVNFESNSYRKFNPYDCFVDYESLSLEQNIVIATNNFFRYA